MHAVVGTLFLALSCVLFVWAYVACRQPSPAPWTRWEMHSQFIVVFNVGLAAFGIGAFARFLTASPPQPFGLEEVALIVAILATATLLVAALRRRWRRLALPAAALAGRYPVGAMPGLGAPANQPGSGGPPPSKLSGGGRRAARRRAA